MESGKVMKNLVIVESPTKARTLSQFLGKDYHILASMGHVRDLPRGEFGVDVEKNFEPKYVIPKEKIKSVNSLVKETVGIDSLWLATDPDREGEAIAWNLLQVIIDKGKVKNQNYQRVVFHEITKDAVLEAFDHARKIDEDLVEAQQARRVLDRLVGYKLSPLLWKKIKSKLSAGRVQSVALKLIVDREREIGAFKSEEYWEIFVEVTKTSDVDKFLARLLKINNEKALIKNKQSLRSSSFDELRIAGLKKVDIKNREQADGIVSDLEKAKYQVADVKTKDAKRSPSAPFTTSTLQQSAANNLGYSAKKTMKLAQDLYEQGLITYMRTDSVNLSQSAISAARQFIQKEYGGKYLPAMERRYKVKSKLAQEAHEAIRPTNVMVNPLRSRSEASSSNLTVASSDHKKLYDIIWKRMVACQVNDAIVAETTIDVDGKSSAKNYGLRASGQEIKFDGWFKVYGKAPAKEQILPSVNKGDDLNLLKVDAEQKFTEPPSRYTEATLIRDLEKNGIGRPSTYAPIISTLYDRFYIERLEARKIGPTPIGKTTTDFLVKYFPNIVDVSFTAGMEDSLDKIAGGQAQMQKVLGEFWAPFEKQVEKVQVEAEKVKVEVEETDESCEKCGKPMVVRYGRFGKFLACSGFPDCKNTKALNEDTGLICPDDGGDVVMRRTKRGRIFWGCSNWPKCKFASWTKPTDSKKPEGEVLKA